MKKFLSVILCLALIDQSSASDSHKPLCLRGLNTTTSDATASEQHTLYRTSQIVDPTTRPPVSFNFGFRVVSPSQNGLRLTGRNVAKFSYLKEYFDKIISEAVEHLSKGQEILTLDIKIDKKTMPQMELLGGFVSAPNVWCLNDVAIHIDKRDVLTLYLGGTKSIKLNVFVRCEILSKQQKAVARKLFSDPNWICCDTFDLPVIQFAKDLGYDQIDWTKSGEPGFVESAKALLLQKNREKVERYQAQQRQLNDEWLSDQTKRYMKRAAEAEGQDQQIPVLDPPVTDLPKPRVKIHLDGIEKIDFSRGSEPGYIEKAMEIMSKALDEREKGKSSNSESSAPTMLTDLEDYIAKEIETEAEKTIEKSPIGRALQHSTPKAKAKSHAPQHKHKHGHKANKKKRRK